MDNIIMLHDEKNYGYYFEKYWNSFVRSDTPKLHFTLDQFLDKISDDDYLRAAINKMEYQDRIISCQYIKRNEEEHGFANFFLMHLPRNNSLCCGSDYYYIYKDELNIIDDHNDKLFLPKRSVYKNFKMDPDSLDYLANFSIPINDNDRIYCLKCEKLIKPKEMFDSKIVNL